MKSRPAAVIFILVTVTLDVLAMGLIIPVLPKLILDFLGGEMTDAAKWSARFAGMVNSRRACWIAAALSLLNWLWGYFFVPESRPQNQRNKFELRRANPVGSLALLRSHHELWRLTTIQFLAYLAHNVFSVWA